MTHSLPVQNMKIVLIVEETQSLKTIITLEDLSNTDTIHYSLDPKTLKDFIGLLLHIQAKNRR